MDKISSERRSKNMAAVRGKDTGPEIKVRKALHGLGYRFRLHRKDLPGKPDIVLAKHQTCIFVHGCFWHQHPGCKRASTPKSNRKFWGNKLFKNRERDEKVRRKLEDLGWRVEVIWECDTKNEKFLKSAIQNCFSLSSKTVREGSNG